MQLQRFEFGCLAYVVSDRGMKGALSFALELGREWIANLPHAVSSISRTHAELCAQNILQLFFKQLCNLSAPRETASSYGSRI